MSKPIGIFLAVLAVGALERVGWADPSQNSENVRLFGEIFSWLVTGVVAVAAIRHETHKKHKEPVVNSNTITGEIGERKYKLQPAIDFFRKLKESLFEQPKPKDYVSTGETTTQ